MSCLKPATFLSDIIQRFKEVRADLLAICMENHQDSALSNSETTNNSKINKIDNRKPVKRIVPTSFLKQSRDKIKKALEKLTEGYELKLRTDGDQDALSRRHREFVHLYNAQVDLDENVALSVVEIIREVNRREEARASAQRSVKHTANVIEQLKNGKVGLIMILVL